MAHQPFSIKFDGVKVKENSMTGTILSDEIIDNFDKSWIDWYQRGRVMRSAKIKELTNIWKNNGDIGSITLNLIGDYIVEEDEGLLEGTFHIVDGQQRILALLDANARGFRVKVELYINLTEEQEVGLFQQQKKATALSFGDFVKSAQGSYADVTYKLLKKKIYPIPVVVNPSKCGVAFGVVCPIFHVVHKKIIDRLDLKELRQGKQLLSFFENVYDSKDVEIVEFAVKNIFESFVSIFGEFDNRARAYSRGFHLAWCAVVTKHFLTPTGKVDFGKFNNRMYDMPDILFTNSAFLELLRCSTTANIFDMRREIICYLNHKLQSGRLPVPARQAYSDNSEEEAAAVTLNTDLEEPGDNVGNLHYAARGR